MPIYARPIEQPPRSKVPARTTVQRRPRKARAKREEAAQGGMRGDRGLRTSTRTCSTTKPVTIKVSTVAAMPTRLTLIGCIPVRKLPRPPHPPVAHAHAPLRALLLGETPEWGPLADLVVRGEEEREIQYSNSI